MDTAAALFGTSVPTCSLPVGSLSLTLTAQQLTYDSTATTSANNDDDNNTGDSHYGAIIITKSL